MTHPIRAETISRPTPAPNIRTRKLGELEWDSTIIHTTLCSTSIKHISPPTLLRPLLPRRALVLHTLTPSRLTIQLLMLREARVAGYHLLHWCCGEKCPAVAGRTWRSEIWNYDITNIMATCVQSPKFGEENGGSGGQKIGRKVNKS